MARKALSKKFRFEVFKRDGFTCQYCGKEAPGVVLHVDHIRPVADGGDNTILNLITSCVDCNLGKGARKLDDNSMAVKQMKVAKELNERREQLEMLAEWKTGLDDLEQKKAEVVGERFKNLTGMGVTPSGLATVKKHIKQFGFESILDAVEIAVNQYVKDPDDKTHIQKAFDYIPRIAYWEKKKLDAPEINGFSHICNLAKKCWYTMYRPTLYATASNAYYKHGVPIETMLELVKETTGIMKFTARLNEVIEGGRNG